MKAADVLFWTAVIVGMGALLMRPRAPDPDDRPPVIYHGTTTPERVANPLELHGEASGALLGPTTDTLTNNTISGHCVAFDASGNMIDAGYACSAPLGRRPSPFIRAK